MASASEDNMVEVGDNMVEADNNMAEAEDNVAEANEQSEDQTDAATPGVRPEFLTLFFLHLSGEFWRPLVTIANNLDPDKAPQNVGPNLRSKLFANQNT